MRLRCARRGFAIIEFTMLALPIMFLTISIVEASIGMWQFHSMAHAVGVATRFAATHGRTCGQNGNSCTITLGTLTTLLSRQAPGLATSKLRVTLYTHAATTTCNPISACKASTAQFPNATDNAVNFDVKIVATYPVANPLPMFWPGSRASRGSAFTLGATSRQRIVF
jgi:Flp pilus assembly protein TadG